MDFQQIRKYVKGALTNSFLNKTTLDKLSTSDKGNLLFDGKEINSSSVEWNQIQTEGIKIAEVTIDGMTTEIFAPNGSSEIGSSSGTFTSPTSSQGTIHIDLGFKPDIVTVFLPLNNKNTCSYFNKFIRTDGAYWDLRPAENNNYFNSFESATGETGICGIDETGFTFRTNSANTFNKECSYTAYKI